MTFTFASGFVVGAFMVGALASLLLPTGVFISLAIWLTRSARRFREPVGQPPVAAPSGTPGQMSAQSATASPAPAPPAAQTPPAPVAPAPAPPAQTPPDIPEPGVQ
jgi:hypothetical protein